MKKGQGWGKVRCGPRSYPTPGGTRGGAGTDAAAPLVSSDAAAGEPLVKAAVYGWVVNVTASERPVPVATPGSRNQNWLQIWVPGATALMTVAIAWL
jgi:hypothetical protein